MSGILDQMAAHLANGMDVGDAMPQGPEYHARYFNHLLAGAFDALQVALKLTENNRLANEVNNIRIKWAAARGMQDSEMQFEQLRADLNHTLDAMVKEVIPAPSTIPYGSIL
jgi:hypothetical protein